MKEGKNSGALLAIIGLVAVLAIVFKYVEVFRVLPLRPQATHLWAQADRASVARNYAEESMNFFRPRVNEVKNHEGITGMEFPLINYLAAVLYKLFGFHEYLYRALMLLIVAGGLICGMLLYRDILKSAFLAILLVITWYLSPVMVFYTANFLPDMASLMFAVAGWFFFFRAQKKENAKALLPAFILFALSALVKITSLINPLALLCVVFCDFALSRLKKDALPLLRYKSNIVIGIACCILAVVGWYAYADWLSTLEDATYFTLEIHPVTSLKEAREVLGYIYGLWFFEYYPKAFYFLLLASAIYIVWRLKRADRRLLLITLFLYLGCFGFFFVMMHQFKDHDYYTLPLYITTFFHLLLFASLVGKPEKRAVRWSVYGLLCVLLLFMAHYAKKTHHNRYYSWHNDTSYFRYHDMEAYLRSVGIHKNDATVTMYDYSPDISLYLMNQKGWSIAKDHDEARIREALSTSKYLVMSDSSLVSNPAVKDYLDTEVGELNGLLVYRLKNQ